ncbi:MFS transporter [Lapillicoccus jejuensis]|uniref:MFS transporter n=1 Tax=Lapillicoccus jejuensis TaxID=402171 RepID=UPI00147787BA|nr:MFS transporter [Lapillicoccus jejuensis]
MGEVDRVEQTAVPSWREVVRVPGVLPILLATALSTWGDYVARLAVASVVFTRTHSPLATATTLAVSYVPTILGSTLLSPLADRFHHRSVLAVMALVRALLVVVLIAAVDTVAPLPLLLGAMALLQLAGGPAASASRVMWVELVPDRRQFVRVMGLSELLDQTNQAVGLALGAVFIALVGVPTSLLLDLLTFLVVAAVVLAVVPRGSPRVDDEHHGGAFGRLLVGVRTVRHDTVLARLTLLSLAAVLGIVAPEAAAIAYARGGPGGGLLMAAPIAGAALGIVVVSRWAPQVAHRRLVPMALLMPVPLLFTAFTPPYAVVWGLWFVSGCLQAFMLPLQTSFAVLSPPARRATIFGLVGALSVGLTGAVYLLVGWLTEVTTAPAAVTMAAVVGLGATVLLAGTWPRQRILDAVTEAFDGAP